MIEFVHDNKRAPHQPKKTFKCQNTSNQTVQYSEIMGYSAEQLDGLYIKTEISFVIG